MLRSASPIGHDSTFSSSVVLVLYCTSRLVSEKHGRHSLPSHYCASTLHLSYGPIRSRSRRRSSTKTRVTLGLLYGVQQSDLPYVCLAEAEARDNEGYQFWLYEASISSLQEDRSFSASY